MADEKSDFLYFLGKLQTLIGSDLTVKLALEIASSALLSTRPWSGSNPHSTARRSRSCSQMGPRSIWRRTSRSSFRVRTRWNFSWVQS
jgi:hypothetical protein